MNDDLDQFLKRKAAPDRAARTAKLAVGPYVKGGRPLIGGPTLDVGPSKAPASPSRHTPHAPGQPHVAIPTGQNDNSNVAGHPETAGSRTASGPKTDETVIDKRLMATALKKSYRKGAVAVPVLTGVDLTIQPGQFTAIVGQSGSGKSTLLHLLGTLDAPDAGEIHFEGRRIDNLPSAQRDQLRNCRFGMIFQFYHLLPEMSTLENVLMPLMITHGMFSYLRGRRVYREKAAELLETVGLGHRLKHKPRELSGGEMQRAAIARSLIAQPDVLLADEPTGNLDHATGKEIMQILRTLNQQQNLTIVMVTHDLALANQSDRIVRLVDGHIEG